MDDCLPSLPSSQDTNHREKERSKADRKTECRSKIEQTSSNGLEQRGSSTKNEVKNLIETKRHSRSSDANSVVDANSSGEQDGKDKTNGHIDGTAVKRKSCHVENNFEESSSSSSFEDGFAMLRRIQKKGKKKGGKKSKVIRANSGPQASQNVQQQPQKEEETSRCPICFDQWHTAGIHRICVLKCGHLFGKICIEKAAICNEYTRGRHKPKRKAQKRGKNTTTAALIHPYFLILEQTNTEKYMLFSVVE
eukprot:jgi/Bigna1/136815/aug1.36_g11523